MNEILDDKKLVYTLPEARAVLNLSEHMILKYLKSGELQGYRVGAHWRVGRDEILRFASFGPLKLRDPKPYIELS